MLRGLTLFVLLLTPAVPAMAEGFHPVHDRARFLDLTKGRELRLAMFDISLRIEPDGAIRGSALGVPVIGEWQWENGYFCRWMEWGQRPIPHNCQLVEAQGSKSLRFTVDRGAGQSAQFRLQ